MAGDQHRLVRVFLDEKTLIRHAPGDERKRLVAVHDLVEESCFSWRDHPESGPYNLSLSRDGDQLLFDLADDAGQPLVQAILALAPFQAVARDYVLICESYFNAIRRSTTSQIEAIDAGRRSLENEGAAQIQNRLASVFDMDAATAGRLFALVAVLYPSV